MVRIMTGSAWLGSWNVNGFNAAGVLAKYRAGKQMTFHISPITYESALAKIRRKLTRWGSTPYHCPGGNEFQSRY